MTRTRAAWRIVFLSYPCPTCDAAPGEDCITAGGNPYRDVHAARTRHGTRCPRCGMVIAWESDPGSYCDKCALLRSLEIERVTRYVRRNER